MTGDELGNVRETYDLIAEDYATTFPSTEPEQQVDLAMIDHFVTLLGAHPRVLDAGCGPGRMARYLTDRGCVAEGIDLSPEMIRMAATIHPDIPVRVATLDELPFGDETFDGAFYWYSLIHTPDEGLTAVLVEALRVLRPEGLILVAFQTGDAAREVGGRYRQLGYDVRITRYHRSADDLARLLSQHGLRPIARLDRAAVQPEQDGQAVIIAIKSARLRQAE